MEKIRKGNDIKVQWAIYAGTDINEAPYDLTGKNLSLYLKNQFGRTEVYDFTTEKHVLSFMFWGKNQQNTGVYSIMLVENEGREGMHTVDECDAFQLVSHSCETGGESEGRVECVHLQFRANMGITIPANGGGSEIVVDNVLSDTSENPVQNKVVTQALKEKVDKVEGKQLSTEDFTSELKGKLEGLSNYDDTKLKNDLEALKGKVDDKQDHIEDLEEIRNGARLGSTALQSHQDISHLATKEEVNAANEKQDEDIAALGEARKNLSSQIADNKSRIDATATNVIKLTEELDILKGEGDGSIEDIVSKEIAKVIASAPEDLDTLREIADFIEAEATEAAQIATKLDDHAERIKKLEDKNLDIVMMTESQYEMLPEKENKLYFLYED